MSFNDAGVEALVKALEAAERRGDTKKFKAHSKRMRFQELTLKLLGYTKEPTWGTSYWTKKNSDGQITEKHNLYGANWTGMTVESIEDTLNNVTFEQDLLK